VRSARWLLPAVLLIAFPASSAFAHKLKTFGFAEGAAIHGSVYFSGNVAAQGARIQVLDPDGGLLAETTSDSEGHFTITARRRVDHRIVADSGDGHHAEYVVRADELPPALARPATSAASGVAEAAEPANLSASAVGSIGPSTAELETVIERAVARQVGPLREQLDAFEDRVRWHDVLGGLGYILGVTGIACYLIARRNRQP
jgi:nickel transport protein